MKKLFVVFLMAVTLTGCGEPKVKETAHETLYTYDEWKEVTDFDDATITFEESERKASPEYWETVTYNSRENKW